MEEVCVVFVGDNEDQEESTNMDWGGGFHSGV